MSKSVLGQSVNGAAVSIDLDRLVSSRMLLTANSGGGKSWALRRILEQTHGKLQQIVLDPEGEFFTLRERFDYVLAGKGGDCPAEPRSAGLLARRLLELGASAIIDLYELAPRERVRFVRLFLEGLIDAPRELWHPALVVLDEAHSFAPEKGHGDAESCEAVARLMAQGRKRGFAGVLATQRLSKLAKDVAAEANNLLIGRAVLDVDVKRAADALGLTKSDAVTALRNLKPGHFYSFGPALSGDVVELKVGEVQTDHPKAGQRSTPPAPPREKVRKVLAQLADLPAEAEAELRTITEARQRITALERELAAAKRAQPEAKVERVDVPVLDGKHVVELRMLASEFATIGDRAREKADEILRTIPKVDAPHHRFERAAPRDVLRPVPAARNGHARAPRPQRTDSTEATSEALKGPERKLLVALAQHGRMSKVKLAVLTNYSHTGGGFLNPLGALRSRGLIEYHGAEVEATPQGVDALGAYEPLPTGAELRERWLGQLSGPEAKLLRAVVDAWPNALSVEDLAERTGYSAKGGGFLNPLGRLRTLELVTRGREVQASPDLF